MIATNQLGVEKKPENRTTGPAKTDCITGLSGEEILMKRHGVRMNFRLTFF
jgi:hypothetical protein